MMRGWKTGDAKQNLSEVLRRCRQEPQEIFNRDRLVAAVISPETYEEFERWRKASQGRTLGQAFDEIREICARYDYEFEIDERRDRDSWIEEDS
jgi:predicted  nucleic acid-binding Zn-ribbon protein